jgi:hypothetical protein
MSRHFLPIFVIALSAAAVAQQESGEAKSRNNKAVVYNHRDSTKDQAYTLRLSDREKFDVVIESTCPTAFDYVVSGIYRAPDKIDSDKKVVPTLETKILEVAHDAKFGGYLVEIRKKDTVDDVVAQCGVELDSRTLIISTPEITWDLSLSGAFTVTSLTNPVFFLRPHPDDPTNQQVQEDPEKRDFAALGIAAFVHLYHHRVPWLAGSFGLGIREGSNTEYLLGGGHRFNDKATLNAGLALGPVTRLPAGVNTTDPVTDPNVLNDLPTRVRRGWFVAISYSFLNVGDRFQKPFAGADATASSPEGATQEGTTQKALCDVAATPATVIVGNGGGAPMVEISAAPDCKWSVEESADWVEVNPPSGEGDGKVEIRISHNAGAGRKTIIKVNGVELPIEQHAGP